MEQKIDKNFYDTLKVLNNSNIYYCCANGTMLGLFRDGNLLPWDKDIDIVILAKPAEYSNLIKSMKPNKKKMYNYSLKGFTTATDFAEYLVKKGVRFREAHKKSAMLVNIAEKLNLTLNELKLEHIKKVYNNFDSNVLNVLKVENSVNSKKSFGGTSKQNVIKMINKTLKELR